MCLGMIHVLYTPLKSHARQALVLKSPPVLQHEDRSRGGLKEGPEKKESVLLMSTSRPM